MPDLTFVTPRYGPEVAGGAEQGARTLAEGLVGEGRSVQVLTTCAVSAVTWDDHLTPGRSLINGVDVHRFPVRRPRGDDFWEFNGRVMKRAVRVDLPTAMEWIDRNGPDSPGLIDAVSDVSDGIVAFYPYIYQPSVRGAMVARTATLLHAAVHREQPLDLCVFGRLFESVDGFAHHTRAEQRLVLDRAPAAAVKPQAVVGLPVERPEGLTVTAGADMRARLGIGDRRLVLYLGRVDPGKGTHDLAAAFASADIPDAVLVLAGPPVNAPPVSERMRVTGLVSEAEKWALLEAADVFVNPSAHESFSLVILEAWLAGTPVLVNGRTRPLAEHCALSGGGLVYTGLADFAAALKRLLADPQARRRLADAGRSYCERRYSWPAVRSRYESLLSRIG